MSSIHEHLSQKEIIVGFCTVPDKKTAIEMGKYIVNEKLAACANIIPSLTSIYIWQEKLEQEEEVLMVIKTRPELKEKLTQRILKMHPYEVPEIIFTPFTGGNSDYIKWVYEQSSIS